MALVGGQALVPYGSTPAERRTMARALGGLFGGGGALVLLTVALPHAGDADVAGLLVPALLALVVAVGLLVAGSRLVVPAVQVLLLAGSALITGCVLYGGAGATAYPLMYLWVAIYAAFFFTPRAAAAQVLFALALYALLLVTTDHVRAPGTHFAMAIGTTAIGAGLIARLAAAVRAQAADLASVSQLAGRRAAAADVPREACEGLVRTLRADVAIMLQPVFGGEGLEVSAMAGSAESGMVFTGERVRDGMQRAFTSGATQVLTADAPATGLRRFDGDVLGLAQPVVRDGETVALLCVAWTTRRRALPERTRSVAILYAAEAGLALDRARVEAHNRERQALEINDNIVQGLVVAKYSAQRGDVERAVEALDETLARARKLITDQLQLVSGDAAGIRPGDLARDEAAGVGVMAASAGPPPPASAG